MAQVTEQEKLLAQAVEGSAEAIVVADIEGRVLYANPAVQEIYGYEPDELVGQSVRIFEPPLRPSRTSEIIGSAREGKWTGEVRVLRKGGAETRVDLTSSAVRDQTGEVIGSVTVARDVSRQRREQEELISAHSQAAVLEHGEAIATELVGIVSHELRTPLTALRGFSELLLTRGHSAAERRTWLKTINKETVRLSQILDDLLDVSRIEGGAVRLELAPVPLESVLQPVVSAFASNHRNHQFHVEDGRESIVVRADEARLRQILENLLSNAVKYSPDGGRVDVTIANESACVSISVSDQGLGIPPEELPNLFSRFHRIHSPDRASIRGSGLGLYITQRLVALHGGTLCAESELGQGSKFTFALPTVQRGEAADEPVAKS